MRSALGAKKQALAFFDQALPLQREVGDKAGEANTLTNIGQVWSDLGDKKQGYRSLPRLRGRRVGR